MKTLAIDTSGAVGSVALVVDGQLVAEVSARLRARQGEVLLPHVDRVLGLGELRPQELDLLAVGVGPGSFTGLRVGLATAKGLALATGVPLRGVVSLAALGRAMALPAANVLAVVDAHKGEVFCAAYRWCDGTLTERVAPFHDKPEQAAERLRPILDDGALAAAGDGARRYWDVMAPRLPEARLLPPLFDPARAAFVAAEAEVLFERDGASELAGLEPLYVRASDAKLPERPLRTDPPDRP